MSEKPQKPPYSLRIEEALKEKARAEAHVYRRSLNAEFELLIEEGFKWRESQKTQASA